MVDDAACGTPQAPSSPAARQDSWHNNPLRVVIPFMAGFAALVLIVSNSQPPHPTELGEAVALRLAKDRSEEVQPARAASGETYLKYLTAAPSLRSKDQELFEHKPPAFLRSPQQTSIFGSLFNPTANSVSGNTHAAAPPLFPDHTLAFHTPSAKETSKSSSSDFSLFHDHTRTIVDAKAAPEWKSVPAEIAGGGAQEHMFEGRMFSDHTIELRRPKELAAHAPGSVATAVKAAPARGSLHSVAAKVKAATAPHQVPAAPPGQEPVRPPVFISSDEHSQLAHIEHEDAAKEAAFKQEVQALRVQSRQDVLQHEHEIAAEESAEAAAPGARAPGAKAAPVKRAESKAGAARERPVRTAEEQREAEDVAQAETQAKRVGDAGARALGFEGEAGLEKHILKEEHVAERAKAGHWHDEFRKAP